MRQKMYLLGLVVCLWMTTLGCSQDQIITPKEPRSMKYPVQVKDVTGQIVQIQKPPKRIISLVPSATEIAYALDLDDEMVAVTNHDNYPAQVKKLPKVGNMKIDLEQVLKYQPDLVLASTANDQNTIAQLRKLKIPVIVTGGQTIKEIYQSILIVAQATNRVWEAEQLVAKMEKEIRQIYGKVVQIPKEKRVKVWVEIGPDLYTVGGDGFLNEMVSLAGGVNVAEKEKGWPKISSEQVVQWKPDVIITTYTGGKQEIMKRKGWESIPAVQKKRVYEVHPDLTSRPSPRFTKGIEELSKRFYPDRFSESQK